MATMLLCLGSLLYLVPGLENPHVEYCYVIFFSVIVFNILLLYNMASKAKQYGQVFLDSYGKEFSCIIKSCKGPNFAFCSICSSDFKIAHSGANDIKIHIKSKKHSDYLKIIEKTSKIQNFFNQDENEVMNAECLFTAFILEHNLPVLVADHAGPLFRKMFPKCETAKRYGSDRTKTTAIIDKMASKNKKTLENMLQNTVFAISTDGSNDSDSQLYPFVVTYDDDLVIGSATSKLIMTLKDDEKISLYSAIRKYYVTCCNYIRHKFPINSDLLKHAEVSDIEKFSSKSFLDIDYFLNKFPIMLPQEINETEEEARDKLLSEFCALQIDNLPEEVINEERMDRKWAVLAKSTSADGTLKYSRLSSIILCILTIPHSNTECERIFSSVRKTRTQFRSSLSDKNLANILITKSMQKGSCYKQTFDKEFLTMSKSATYEQLNCKKTE